MNATRLIISILSIWLISTTAIAAELSDCLISASQQEHRLEKEDSIRFCFNKYKTSITKEICYLFLEQRVSKLSLRILNEEISSICFYETTPAKDMNSCLTETKKFKNATNHDEAIFYCYQQFQDRLTQKDCLKTAEQLIYPLKKEYLRQHCNNSFH